MDVYPNSVAVSGSQGSSGSPAELVPCMPSSSTIPDFINVEGSDDANLEWLSMLVEDCLSTTPCYTPTPTPPAPTPTTITASNTPSQPPMGPPLQENLVQSKARAKRTKLTPRAQNQVLYVDPPLVHQTQWLADSELIYPKDNQLVQSSVVLVGGEEDKGMEQEQQQQPRRCAHCHSQKTPQWRAGPLGPKTLCNACGVRFKSGRLLPEYRPAKSPTFVSFKHSNSHKKVMEMRMALLSPNTK